MGCDEVSGGMQWNSHCCYSGDLEKCVLPICVEVSGVTVFPWDTPLLPLRLSEKIAVPSHFRSLWIIHYNAMSQAAMPVISLIRLFNKTTRKDASCLCLLLMEELLGLKCWGIALIYTCARVIWDVYGSKWSMTKWESLDIFLDVRIISQDFSLNYI